MTQKDPSKLGAIDSDIDRERILADLSVFLLAEESLMAAAARRLDDAMRERIQQAIIFEKRCALVGDIEILLQADAAVEALICEAAGEPEAAAELQAMKREFKETWSASNRLKDITPEMNYRVHQVECLLAGDETGAATAIRRFYRDVHHRI